jgi:hypothetical protein
MTPNFPRLLAAPPTMGVLAGWAVAMGLVGHG